MAGKIILPQANSKVNPLRKLGGVGYARHTG